MATTISPMTSTLDVARIRADFPILQTLVRGSKPLVYLDNGATSQKPQSVIDAESQYYAGMNSNVHRGVHYLSDLATRAFEASRDRIQAYLNAAHRHEIIFTKGTTDAINLVANSFGRQFFKPGDEVIISGMEHHSNIVPWHLVREWTGITVRAIPVTDSGELDMEAYAALLSDKTRLVAVNHVSNALGTVNPVADIIALAHQAGAAVLIDGAQAMPHMRVDVQALDVDFYIFSGHKVFGPTGTGVLYGKDKWLQAMPPYQGGGDMIDRVTLEGTTYNVPPHRFEAGTPNIAGIIGLGAAIDYLAGLDMAAVQQHEAALLSAATDAVLSLPGMHIIGTAAHKASVLSFYHPKAHPSDLGTLLDFEGVAIRTGHHCAQPLMDRFGVPATARASFAFYNTLEEVEIFAKALHKAYQMLQ